MIHPRVEHHRSGVGRVGQTAGSSSATLEVHSGPQTEVYYVAIKAHEVRL